MSRQITLAAAGGLLLVAAAWGLTSGGGARLRAQLQVAAGSAREDMPIRTGMSPGRYGPPCPAGSIRNPLTGRHPLKSHPTTCSPRMSTAMRPDVEEWLFCPPSEEDL